MQIFAAPMEGITGYIYRLTHQEYFGGCDRYFMPFIDPKDHGSLMRKEKKDIDPDNNRGIRVVPQILTNRPDKFIRAACMLFDLGYREVNLNLGCPSGTVVARGKGSGFLKYPDRLRAFFEAVFDSPLIRNGSDRKVSVKTRLGMEDPEEILDLMTIYNDYPLSEVIIHARVRADFYKKPVNRTMFGRALGISRHPVCYNGDIFSREDLDRLVLTFPDIHAVMLGRGLIGNPGLAGNLKKAAVAADQQPCESSGEICDLPAGHSAGQNRPAGGVRTPAGDGQDMPGVIPEEELPLVREFMTVLCDRYEEAIGGNALFKMKEIWGFMLPRLSGADLPGVKKAGKKLMKAKNLSEYRLYAKSLTVC